MYAVMVFVRLATGTECSRPDCRLTPRAGIENAAWTPAGQGGGGADPGMLLVSGSTAVTVARGGPPARRIAASPPSAPRTTTTTSTTTQRRRWLRRARWRGPRRGAAGRELTVVLVGAACWG